MAVMTNTQFVEKLKDAATNHKTLYVMGCFGAPLTGRNVDRYLKNHSYNRRWSRQRKIKAAANQNPPVYGFDCVCLLKGILWGWNANPDKTYGGATYCANDVPDVGADTMIRYCRQQSTDFGHIEPGEAVWTPGHIGVYIGDGLAVECTPSWEDKVQITACNVAKSGYKTRKWEKHGKLPYVEYIVEKKTNEEIAKEVINGKWGTGAERKRKLAEAGYDAAAVQALVNEMLRPKVKYIVNATGTFDNVNEAKAAYNAAKYAGLEATVKEEKE